MPDVPPMTRGQLAAIALLRVQYPTGVVRRLYDGNVMFHVGRLGQLGTQVWLLRPDASLRAYSSTVPRVIDGDES
jgi:hypothetical protein